MNTLVGIVKKMKLGLNNGQTLCPFELAKNTRSTKHSDLGPLKYYLYSRFHCEKKR